MFSSNFNNNNKMKTIKKGHLDILGLKINPILSSFFYFNFFFHISLTWLYVVILDFSYFLFVIDEHFIWWIYFFWKKKIELFQKKFFFYYKIEKRYYRAVVILFLLPHLSPHNWIEVESKLVYYFFKMSFSPLFFLENQF